MVTFEFMVSSRSGALFSNSGDDYLLRFPVEIKVPSNEIRSIKELDIFQGVLAEALKKMAGELNRNV